MQQFKIPENLDFWSQRFLREGEIWGGNPSVTAKIMSRILSPRHGRVYEIGYGYGRDLSYLADQGHSVAGIDESEVGYDIAREQLSHQRADIDGLGYGDFTGAVLADDFYDAVYSHRVLHLIKSDKGIKELTERCVSTLKPNGLIVVSARDPRDFIPAQMEIVSDGIAEYKGRPAHVIRFWDREQYRKAFSRDFNIQAFFRGSELESKQNPVPSYFTTMVALRRP